MAKIIYNIYVLIDSDKSLSNYLCISHIFHIFICPNSPALYHSLFTIN